jgi:flavin-dependent dehydrogenase
MFSYFLLDFAEITGTDFYVDIYEPRHFTHCGPAGCNHCGGIVSESLLQRLATEGIDLPSHVVQRGVNSYTLHMDVGTVRLDAPRREKRIAAVYRGNGPRDSEPLDSISFDGYLNQLAVRKGARMVRRMVTALDRTGDSICVTSADATEYHYDLVVVATGINSHFLDAVCGKVSPIREPEKTTTFICEFRMGRSLIEETLGDSMHVFLLDIPGLEFAALIPKGDYVTLCMLGDEIDDTLIRSFFASTEFRQCFPDAIVPPHVCHCLPRINIQSARYPFDDRIVLIGDSGTTRLFKDGLGAAYRTAKAAARTAVFHGVSAKDFEDYYWPLCRNIDTDNSIGKFVFSVSGLIQKARFSRRAVLRMTAGEQASDREQKRMSEVLWDIFSGSAPYREILTRTMHPAYVGGLIWNLAASNWPATRRRGPGAAGQGA